MIFFILKFTYVEFQNDKKTYTHREAAVNSANLDPNRVLSPEPTLHVNIIRRHF